MQSDEMLIIPLRENYQGMVRSFNLSIGATADIELRIKLIKEEAQEFIDAVEAKDPIEAIDALCDLLYVVYGAADCLHLGYLDTETEARSAPSGEDPDWSRLHKELQDFVQEVNQVVLALARLNNPILDKTNEGTEAPARLQLESLARGCWECAAVGIGVDLRPFYREVHRTNMHKLTGPKRADGKQLKPEGWKPPRIKTMYNRVREGLPVFCRVTSLAHESPLHRYRVDQVLPHSEGGNYCDQCGGVFLDVEFDIGMEAFRATKL